MGVNDRVQISHPKAGTAVVSRSAFDRVWAKRGWVLAATPKGAAAAADKEKE